MAVSFGLQLIFLLVFTETGTYAYTRNQNIQSRWTSSGTGPKRSYEVHTTARPDYNFHITFDGTSDWASRSRRFNFPNHEDPILDTGDNTGGNYQSSQNGDSSATVCPNCGQSSIIANSVKDQRKTNLVS